MPELPDHCPVQVPELHREPVLDATNRTIYTSRCRAIAMREETVLPGDTYDTRASSSARRRAVRRWTGMLRRSISRLGVSMALLSISTHHHGQSEP